MNGWIAELDRITRSFLEQFGHLTREEIVWKPETDRWSIGENLQHLMLLNKSYYPIFKSVRNGSWKPPLTAKIPGIPGVVKKMLHTAVRPDRKRRMKTFPIWEPGDRELPDDLLNRFEAQQNGLKEQIFSLEESLKKGVIIGSPANRYLVYPLEDALDIIITHEKRHLEQCREVLHKLSERSG